MIYSNYIRSYNNMISRMDKINEDIPAVSGIKNINTSDNSLNNIAYQKKNDYVNNMKEYSKYNKESKEFYSEFDEKFTKLKESAKKLKSYSPDSVFIKKYNNNDIKKAGSEGSENNTTEDQNTKIFNAVENFATNYNEAITFLKNNSDKSEKISDLAQSYTNIFKYNKSTMSGIGINIDSDGKLIIDKDKLANAIRDNKNTVRNALGDSTSGVANKIYNKTTTAMMQSKELYPAAKLKNDYINNTYFFNPNNSSILHANQMYSSGLFLDILL